MPIMTLYSNQELIEKARKIAKLHRSSENVKTGEVGCALVSETGNIYKGVSIDACCGIGFCAESSAIASMVLNGEYQIARIVAVDGEGTVMPPCGRCREFMYQIDARNYDAEIILSENSVVRLEELLPEPWQKRVSS